MLFCLLCHTVEIGFCFFILIAGLQMNIFSQSAMRFIPTASRSEPFGISGTGFFMCQSVRYVLHVTQPAVTKH